MITLNEHYNNVLADKAIILDMTSILESNPLPEVVALFEGMQLNEITGLSLPSAVGAYATTVNIGSPRVTDQAVLDQIHKYLVKLGEINWVEVGQYLIAVKDYIISAGIAGLSGAALAQVIGWILMGIAKVLDKDIEKNMEARQVAFNIKYKKATRNMKMEDMSDDEIIKTYKKLRKKINTELDQVIPTKRAVRIATILDKVGKAIKSKYGTVVMSLVGIILFAVLTGFPIYPVAI